MLSLDMKHETHHTVGGKGGSEEWSYLYRLANGRGCSLAAAKEAVTSAELRLHCSKRRGSSQMRLRCKTDTMSHLPIGDGMEESLLLAGCA